MVALDGVVDTGVWRRHLRLCGVSLDSVDMVLVLGLSGYVSFLLREVRSSRRTGR